VGVLPRPEVAGEELKEERVKLVGRGRLAVPLGATAAILVVAAPAGASSWDRPTLKGRVQAAHLAGVRAKKRVKDAVRTRPLARTSSRVPIRVERYLDEHGHSIVLGTSIRGLELQEIASLLAGVVHRDELNALMVKVVAMSDVPGECQAPADVMGCYAPVDPARVPDGTIVIGYDDPDLKHTLVHEYGHHMDNQLLNLWHLGGACDYSSDGSRRWFFARDADDRIIDNSGCEPWTPYERLLPELYAEDFVALNGISDWLLTEFRSPSPRALRALRADIFHPFLPGTTRRRGRLRRRGASRTYRFRLRAPTYFSAELRGPGGQWANFDLYLLRRGRPRPLARSTRRRSREDVERLVDPGVYELAVRARRGAGSYRLRVDLD
jgi:hypothetical protein